ncbi:hypothetical protein [Niveispirillum sp. SYP-B3756]|uniref:hypothetical protein n=1 Tax=Niveispirillum sp. SYP-B3756 TaxID=2662178 RepID=UPI0012910FF3|nr:hypothetical protein [Niveispirillum sp. SYP-B3756]
MKSAFIRVLGLAGLVLLAGGAEGTPPASEDADISAQINAVLYLPEGPLPALPEPPAAARFLKEAEATNDTEKQMAAYRQAAALGSPLAQYQVAILQEVPDTKMLFDLSRRGYGQAVVRIYAYAALSYSTPLRQSAPYWLNIAARTADPHVSSIWDEILGVYRFESDFPAVAGRGLYFDDPFIFPNHVSGNKNISYLERKTVNTILPGWIVKNKSETLKNGMKFHVISMKNDYDQIVNMYFCVDGCPDVSDDYTFLR